MAHHFQRVDSNTQLRLKAFVSEYNALKQINSVNLV